MQLGFPHPALDVLGLVTDGVLGIIPSDIDPPFVAPATPTSTGGTILPGRRDGVWLLDFDVGGTVYRFATREVRVPSRICNATVVYAAGLTRPTPVLDAETLEAAITSGVDWASLRATHGPVTGREFRLRFWYDGQVLEDAYLALQGVFRSARFADIATPNGLQIGLSRADAELSRELVTAEMTVSDDTWPAADPQIAGSGYPVVVGYPGRGEVAGSPGLYVNDAQNWLIIAAHRVEATTVRVFNVTDGLDDVAPVVYKSDGLDRQVAVADLTGISVSPAFGKAFFASFESGSGSAVHGGKAVSGLGDVLVWGASLYSSVIHDFGEMESRRDALNVYKIDACINAPGVIWDDWVQQNLVDLFNLEVVHGPRGVYYRQIRFAATEAEVVARLTTGRDGGIRVSRSSDLQETTEDVCNTVSVQYAPVAGSTSDFTGSLTIGPSRTATQVPDARCQRSKQIYGVRAKTFKIAVTFDRPTALLVALDAVARYALPHVVATYVGGSDLWRLRKGDVVRVYDTVAGARFSGDLAIVTAMAFQDAETVEVTVLFP